MVFSESRSNSGLVSWIGFFFFFLTQISSHFLLLYLVLTLQSEWWFYNVGHLQYLLISKPFRKAGSVLWASFLFHLLLHMLYSPGIIPTSFSVEASWGFCVCFLVFCSDPPLINSSRYCVQLRHGFHLTFSSLHLTFEFYPPLIQSLDITVTNSFHPPPIFRWETPQEPKLFLPPLFFYIFITYFSG